MSIVLVDNNVNSLHLLANAISKLLPTHQVQTFTDPLMSAKYICNNEVVLVFLTAEMRPVDGFILLRTLRVNKPSLPIVMLLSNEAQRETALCEADGCLVNPVSSKALEKTVKQILFV